MYTEEVAKNIYRIPVTLPNSPLKELNSYLIKDPERSLLIDTGFAVDTCLESLLRGLGELGTDSKNLEIFLTHMHSDHTGLAAEISGEGMPIYISAVDGKRMNMLLVDERPVYKDMVKRFLAAGMPTFITDNMKTISPAIAYSPRIKSDHYVDVQDGKTFTVGGYSFRCILTPGHTPGHMCLWDENSGIMFTGDHVLFDITPNITSWSYVIDSLSDYLNSLQKTYEYPVRTALPGHRKTGVFHTRIKELLRHHEIRLAEVEKIVRETPGSIAYDIAGKMHWKIRAVNWEEFPPAQKIFAVGECLSHIDYLINRDIITYQKDGNLLRYFCV